MPQGQGRDAKFYILDEDAASYAQDPAAPDARRLHLVSNGLVPSQPDEPDETLTGSRDANAPIPDVIDVAGSMSMVMNAESMSFLLKHLFGAPSTSGVNPYTHVFTPGEPPVGFIVENDLGAQLSSGRYDRFYGNKIGGASFEVFGKGRPMFSVDVKGANVSRPGALLDATPTDPGHNPMGVTLATALQEGGTDWADVKELKINVNTDLDEDSYAIAGGGVRNELSAGMFMVSGSLTALLRDNRAEAKADAHTETSLTVNLQRGTGLGSAGNERVFIELPTLVLEKSGKPVSGPKGILQSYNFKAYGSPALRVTVYNQIATI